MQQPSQEEQLKGKSRVQATMMLDLDTWDAKYNKDAPAQSADAEVGVGSAEPINEAPEKKRRRRDNGGYQQRVWLQARNSHKLATSS